MKKGNFTLAIEEAVRDWIKKQRRKRREVAKKAWRKRKEKEKLGSEKLGTEQQQG